MENQPPHSEVEPSNKFLAFGASLVQPGLGQLYNGHLGKAVSFCLLAMFLAPALIFMTGPWWLDRGLPGTYLALTLHFGFRIAIAVEAAWSAGAERVLKPYHRWWVYLAILIVGQLVLAGLRSFDEQLPLKARSFHAASGSMVPTLEPGDMFFADLTAYARTKPVRMDVAVFHPPDNPALVIVKRIVGLPGETIEVADGQVWIDGKTFQGPWAAPSGTFEAQEIPEGHYFLLGDNIDHSRDSRSFGAVPKRNLVGKARVLFWPPWRADVLDTH